MLSGIERMSHDLTFILHNNNLSYTLFLFTNVLLKSLQYIIILINLNKNIFFNYETIMQVAMLIQIFTKFFVKKIKDKIFNFTCYSKCINLILSIDFLRNNAKLVLK